MMRRAVLALGALIALAVPASAPAALLDTVKVDSAATTVTKGKVTLFKGRTYTLKLSGTYSEVSANGLGYRFDALFCVTGIGAAKNDCADHPRATDFKVTTGESTFKDADLFGGPLQEYKATHTYTVRFTPPASGVLRAGMSRAYKPCASCTETASGTVTVQVYGTSGGGGSSGGNGGGNSAATGTTKVSSHHPTCRKSLRAAAAASNPWCPFGVLGILPPPKVGNAADVSSAPLPDSTRSLNLVVDMQDPQAEGFFDEYAVATIVPVNPVEGQSNGCMIVGAAFSASPIAFTFDGKSTLVACATLAKKYHSRPKSCHVWFVPGFENSATPTRAVIAEAQKRMADSVVGKCARPNKTQLSVTMRAAAGSSLNAALGTRAHAASGSFVRSGVSPGPKARLVYGWGVSSG